MTDDERRNRRNWQYREGRWCLTKEEMTDRDGNVRRFYTVQVGRDGDPGGHRFLAAPDLALLKNRLRGAIQELRNEREQGRNNTQTGAILGRQDGPRGSAGDGERRGELYHAVVKVQGINEDGTAKLEVVSVADKEHPHRPTSCTGDRFPFYFHHREKPAVGHTLDVPVGPGQSVFVNEAVDQFRRYQERGRFYCMGVWNDESSSPVERQTLVKFSNGVNFGGRYEDRTVTPTTGQLPGQQWEKLYVVFEKHHIPGKGRVVGFTTDRQEAVEMVKTLDRQRLGQEQGKAPQQVNHQQPRYDQLNRPLVQGP